MEENIIEIRDVNKFFGDNHVVRNLNMDIRKGEFLTLLGPSGCGKTTTLRMIAGFEVQSEGEILVEGVEVKDAEPYQREVNTVFQNYALFPHMSIYDNIAYGLMVKKVPKNEIKVRVSEMLELVQLQGFEKRKPDQLSGGQKQRVAIARALINRPKVLLLDEPLGALDLKLRKQMQFELKRLQRKLGITFIYVTHDQEEALTMSDRIGIMYQGNLDQLGTPREIYEKPRTKFVADFIGESNIFYGVVEENELGTITVKLENGFCRAVSQDAVAEEIVHLSIRPENIIITSEIQGSFGIPGVIKEHVYVGNVQKTMVALGNGYEVTVNGSVKKTLLPVESKVFVSWDEKDAVVIKSKSQKVFSVIDNPVM